MSRCCSVYRAKRSILGILVHPGFDPQRWVDAIHLDFVDSEHLNTDPDGIVMTRDVFFEPLNQLVSVPIESMFHFLEDLMHPHGLIDRIEGV